MKGLETMSSGSVARTVSKMLQPKKSKADAHRSSELDKWDFTIYMSTPTGSWWVPIPTSATKIHSTFQRDFETAIVQTPKGKATGVDGVYIDTFQ